MLTKCIFIQNKKTLRDLKVQFSNNNIDNKVRAVW